MIQAVVRILRRLSKPVLFYAACAVCLTGGALVLSLLGASPEPSGSGDHIASVHRLDAGWGAAAIAAPHRYEAKWSPIAAANACGMGASSCFKCHAAGRGPAISEKPWHSDHSQVNNDCVGCHHGSPYLLKKTLAHADLVPDPRTAPDKSCTNAGCHQSDEANKLVVTYRNIGTQPNK
jgi:hypothetical protein